MLALGIIKESIIKFYDELFKFVIVNILWFSILILPFLFLYISTANIVFIILILYLLIIAGPLMMSGLSYIDNSLNRFGSDIKDFFIGIKENFKRGIQGFLFTFFAYFLIIIDLIFFLQRSENYLMMIISMLFFYMLIIFSMMQIYFWGLLTIRKDVGFLQIVKQSFALVLDNIFPTILVFLFLVIIFILNLVLAIIMPFFFFMLTALVFVITSKTILKKYETEQE